MLHETPSSCDGEVSQPPHFSTMDLILGCNDCPGHEECLSSSIYGSTHQKSTRQYPRQFPVLAITTFPSSAKGIQGRITVTLRTTGKSLNPTIPLTLLTVGLLSHSLCQCCPQVDFLLYKQYLLHGSNKCCVLIFISPKPLLIPCIALAQHKVNLKLGLKEQD